MKYRLHTNMHIAFEKCTVMCKIDKTQSVAEGPTLKGMCKQPLAIELHRLWLLSQLRAGPGSAARFSNEIWIAMCRGPVCVYRAIHLSWAYQHCALGSVYTQVG